MFPQRIPDSDHRLLNRSPFQLAKLAEGRVIPDLTHNPLLSRSHQFANFCGN